MLMLSKHVFVVLKPCYLDRYDARGALHDLSALEAPPGGYDWRVELTKGEWEVEQLCDEERYRALHADEDEEEMYKGISNML
jgi:hypothetical protein